MKRLGMGHPRLIAGVVLAAAAVVVVAALFRGAGIPQLARLSAERRAVVEKIDAALARSAKWLRSQQTADGGFPSRTYGVLKDGAALSPHVLLAVGDLPERLRRPLAEVGRRGDAYVAGFATPEGGVAAGRFGLAYPVYTAAESVTVLSRQSEAAGGRAAWLKLLRDHQLTEANGWSPADPEYGGWSYSIRRPQKPADTDPNTRDTLLEPNISATLYAVEALRAAGLSPDAPAIAAAGRFALSCQNFSGDAGPSTPFDDGGFFFSPHDVLKNKAGIAGQDAGGRRRFTSYGTMTADGLRILLLVGYKADHPRVVAARKWIERNFDPRRQPGGFPEDREMFRYGMYYYYTNSVARALAMLGRDELPTAKGPVRWAEALASRLVEIQRVEGTWTNGYTDSKEDDPLVATPLAMGALIKCRERIVAGR